MSQIPIGQIHYQEFVDAFRIKWIYNAKDNIWSMIGPVSDIPIARSNDNEDGPTYGLFSAKDKATLNALSNKAGGFGFLLKPGRYLTEDNAADNILTGNVKIVSDSLSFVNTVYDCDSDKLTVDLSRDFIDSYCLEIKGPPGLPGANGDPGKDGRMGTGDGPTGDPGKDGEDKTVLDEFGGIVYEELSGIYDTAVVDLRIDQSNCILDVVKADVSVAGSSKPASTVLAQPTTRDIKFNSISSMDGWTIISPSHEQATADLNIVRIPKGWSGDSDHPLPVIPYKISDMASSIISYYKQVTNKITARWDNLLYEWAKQTDKDAREKLHGLASELAECEFTLPLEFCLGFESSDCNPEGDAVQFQVVNSAGEECEVSAPPTHTTSELKTAVVVFTADSNANNDEIMRFNRLKNVDLRVYELGREFEPKNISGMRISSVKNGFDGTLLANSITSNIDTICVFIDKSSGLTLEDLEPGYSEFIESLTNSVNAHVFETDFNNDNWLVHTNQFLEELLA